MMLHTKFKALSLMVSDKKIFSCFSLYKPIYICKTWDPPTGPFLVPGA